MSDNRINTLCRIDQSIRGLNEDAHDDSYIPAQSENGALERINKSIQNLDIKGIKSGLPKVTNKDNGKILQVINGKWGKGEIDISSKVGVVVTAGSDYIENYETYKDDTAYLYLVQSASKSKVKNSIFTEANAKVTVSGNSDKAYLAFNGNFPQNGSSANSNSWYDNNNTSTSATPWIAYEFDSSIIVDSFIVRYGVVAHSYGEGGNFTIDIQGSNDGETWTSLLEEAKIINITSSGATSSEWSDVDYTNDIVSTDAYKYVRLLFNQGMYSNPGQTVYVGEIQIAGVKELEETENQIYYEGQLYANTSAGGSAPSGPTKVCLYQATDYGHAKLWSSDNWNNVSTWITLADGHTIDEFDEIQIVSVTSEGDQPNVHRYDNLVTYIVNAEDLVPQTGTSDNVKARIFWQSRQTGQQRDCDLTFSQDLTKVHPASSPAWYVIIYAIYGIKY